MIEIDDKVFEKLKKNADDNRQIRNIISIIATVLIFLVLYFGWGRHLVNLEIERREAELQTNIAIEQAETNVRIREIESAGMTNEEYFKWLEVRGDDSSD